MIAQILPAWLGTDGRLYHVICRGPWGWPVFTDVDFGLSAVCLLLLPCPSPSAGRKWAPVHRPFGGERASVPYLSHPSCSNKTHLPGCGMHPDSVSFGRLPFPSQHPCPRPSSGWVEGPPRAKGISAEWAEWGPTATGVSGQHLPRQG